MAFSGKCFEYKVQYFAQNLQNCCYNSLGKQLIISAASFLLAKFNYNNELAPEMHVLFECSNIIMCLKMLIQFPTKPCAMIISFGKFFHQRTNAHFIRFPIYFMCTQNTTHNLSKYLSYWIKAIEWYSQKECKFISPTLTNWHYIINTMKINYFTI